MNGSGCLNTRNLPERPAMNGNATVPDKDHDDRRDDLETTLCPDGRHINVRNPRSGSGDVHTVELDGSGVKGCTCKGWTFHETCYHVDSVRNSPLLLASARAASSTTATVATDGGVKEVGERTVRTDLGGDKGNEENTDEDDDSDDSRPATDHWGEPLEHFDDGVCGAGEACQCQSCGTRFEIAMVAATADSSNRNWEEFYRCETCGARGTFRFIGETDRREWTGRIDYPEDGL